MEKGEYFMKKRVNTKKEFREALRNKEKIIIVGDDLKKELKPIVKLMKLPRKKLIATIGFISTTGAAIVGAIVAAPPTGGMSMVATSLMATPAVAGYAMTSGVSIAIVVGVLVLCVSLGVSMVLEVLNNYNMEYEIKYMGLVFRRKVASKETDK